MEKAWKIDTIRWETYLGALERCSIPEEKWRWYVRWAERFAAFLGERPLETAERSDVEAFITSLSHSLRIETWQVRQASDALRILLVMGFGKRWGEGLGLSDTDSGAPRWGSFSPFTLFEKPLCHGGEN